MDTKKDDLIMETVVISKQSLDTFTHDKNVVGITQQEISIETNK